MEIIQIRNVSHVRPWVTYDVLNWDRALELYEKRTNTQGRIAMASFRYFLQRHVACAGGSMVRRQVGPRSGSWKSGLTY